MRPAPDPLLTLLLPGLDGSGRLFDRFRAAAVGGPLELRTVSYPGDRVLAYAELEARVVRDLPTDRPFALLAESFSGPVALRVAARAPPGLVGVVLAASFHRRPASPAVAALEVLAPLFFRLPLPAHAVRLLLGGGDAADDLVAEVQRAVAAVPGRVMLARTQEALRVDATDALRACPVPLLFLCGAADRLLRRALAEEVRAARPDAEIRTLAAPHLVLQRQPREALAVIAQFLVDCARRQGGRVA
jgi:pimeloyl-ACP methyl ester carboxylesterase